MFLLLSPMSVKNLFRKPATRLYPKTPYRALPATRGSIRLDYEGCNFCTLCAKRCPSNAIEVDRPGKSWTIDRLRCIVCGYCVEVCAKNCLILDEHYTPPLLAAEKASACEFHGPPTEVEAGTSSTG